MSTKICFKLAFAFPCSSSRMGSTQATVYTDTLFFQPSHFSLKLNPAYQTDATQPIFINNDTIQMWRYMYLTKMSNVIGSDQLIESCLKNHQRFCFCQRACLPHLNIAPSPFLAFFSDINLPCVSWSRLDYGAPPPCEVLLGNRYQNWAHLLQ